MNLHTDPLNTILAAIRVGATPLTESAILQGATLDGFKVYITLGGAAPEILIRVKSQIEEYFHGHKPEYTPLVTFTAHKKSPAVYENISIPHVKKVILVSSCKGGVGKSTMALGLAACMAQSGAKVALLDADVFGPSLPVFMGEQPKVSLREDKLMIPVPFGSLKVMSIGFMIDPQNPIIWRGPMVMGAINDLLFKVAWNDDAQDVDVLVIDMPPGTGDTQLTIVQKVKIDGAVIVTTPHELAVSDTIRGVAMFQKLEIPVLGIIENMAYFLEENSPKKHFVFGPPKGAELAAKMGFLFLGDIPLHPRLYEEVQNAVKGNSGSLLKPIESAAESLIKKLNFKS